MSAPHAIDPKDRPAWTDAIDNPYLHGIHAPVVAETTARDLPVEGALPRDLYGSYVRNGPNPVHAPTNMYHWFDGDGMLHAVHFRDGKADYCNRWVRTTGLVREESLGRSLWPGLIGPFDFELPDSYLKDTANTDVLFHNGDLLATWYVAGAVYRVDPLTLESRGREDWNGKVDYRVSAHPKVDERTGELLFFHYGDEFPYMKYGVVSAAGELVHEIPVELPGPRLPHDLTFTERWTILHDPPLFHDAEELSRTRRRIVRFHPELPLRFAVVPRFGGPEEIRWFEFEPGYVLHMVNAWEEGPWIVMDGCFQPDPTLKRRPEEGPLGSMLAYFRGHFHLHRWRMNLATGETRQEPLDDLNVEFPLPDTSRLGVRSRYSYHQELLSDGYTLLFPALVKYDHETGSRVRHPYGEGWFGSESCFAPRQGRDPADEDDGYVVSFVTLEGTLRSECQVFDARRIEAGPIARVQLPVRVPTGFHAHFTPGDELWG